jgi:putative ABC transport system substrate-binding protein
MNRREFITLLGGAAAWPLAAQAQQTLPVIGYLNAGALHTYTDALRAFRQALKESGHTEGETVAIDYRVAALMNPAEPTIFAANRRDVEAAAGAMELQLRLINASTIAQIDAAFAALANERPDALFISSGPFFGNRLVQLAHLASRHAIPAISGRREYAEVGGLMSYGTSLAEAHRHAGSYAVRILKGAKPSDLPVVQSTKFELIINASTARMLGLTVPASLLAVADEVIE